MAKRLLRDKLIPREQIKEEIRPIEESDVDYITPSGNVFCDYGDNLFYQKSTFVNKHNGYLYVSIKSRQGKQIQRRVHILVAKAFLPNPNNYPIVMHINDDKTNANVDNLMWSTISNNTKMAFDHGLAHNAKGFEDSQSNPVCSFDNNFILVGIYGSATIAAKETGMTLGGVLFQCKHEMKSHPRKGLYFRFYDEYKKSGFVL